MIAVNRSRGKTLGDRILAARTFLERLRGLLGRTDLARGEGLWIAPCRSIHTFGMSFPIDALFLDGEGRVIVLYEELRPFRATRSFRGAAGVLELPAGTIRRTGTVPGDVVEIREAGV